MLTNVLKHQSEIQVSIHPICSHQTTSSVCAVLLFSEFTRLLFWLVRCPQNTGRLFHHAYEQVIDVVLQLSDVGIFLFHNLLLLHEFLHHLPKGQVAVGVDAFLWDVRRNQRREKQTL